MGNKVFQKINYISWKHEAKRILLSNDDMKEKLKEIMATRKVAASNTKRVDFTEETYKVDVYGDYASLYIYEDGEYRIYCNNLKDKDKNVLDKPIRVDRLFQAKFKELNGVGLQAAYGFVDKSLKRCIPKQFYYVNKKYCNKKLIMSSIDASSQYPSGCLGKLPDMHGAQYIDHYAEPTEEYPFAFYATGHLAIYNELDTHEWFANKFWPYLFRFSKNDEDWPFRNLPQEQEHTILMKASPYTMDSTWNYFYLNKKNCHKDSVDYEIAKLIMNGTIGCWHRKDKAKKSIMTYDDDGSFQLAHIVAVAIARGNQKILNKIDELKMDAVAHVCVDGIIYIGDEVFGAQEAHLGQFCQEFVGVPTVIKDINVYLAKNNEVYKFKHGGFDLIDGKDIDESKEYDFKDLDKLSVKERVGDIIKQWEDQRDQKIAD